MNIDVADRFICLVDDDRRRVEVAATALLWVDACAAPRGKGSAILAEAMRMAEEIKREQFAEEKKQ